MWIKKTDEELLSKPRKTFFIKLVEFLENPNYIIIFLFFFIFLILTYKFIGSGYIGLYKPPLSWKELIDSLPKIGIESLAILLLFYISNKFWIKKPERYKRPMICEKCNNIKDFDNENNCNCGGRFISLDEMKWIDDK